MEIEDVAGTIIEKLRPLASWAIWRPVSSRKASIIEEMELRLFISDHASGYVSEYGSFVVFEHYDDALLWIMRH